MWQRPNAFTVAAKVKLGSFFILVTFSPKDSIHVSHLWKSTFEFFRVNLKFVPGVDSIEGSAYKYCYSKRIVE